MNVALFLVITIAGALAAVVTASVGSPPAAFAGALVLTFVGFAGACGAAAVALHASDELREPREPLGPTGPVEFPDDGITRPGFGRLWAAAIGMLAVLGVVPLVALSRKPGRRVPTGWGAGVALVDEDNVPVASDQLDVGGVATVFPRNGVELPGAAAMLIRLPDRYVAYSKICTHAGCPVALYRRAAQELYCPCHQSRFDVLHGAANLSGPAPRPLPQLPLRTGPDGFLLAAGDFDGPVGPDDWDRVR